MTEKLLTQNINRIWSSLIVDEFIKNNITQFYLSPGMRNAPIVAALDHFKKLNAKVDVKVCWDERSASYRALGYTKATGLPAVLICTSGTALANYMPAVIEAKKSNLSLIVLSCDRPVELTYCDDNQTIDQTKLYGQYIQGEMAFGAPTIDISPLAMTSSLSNLINKSLFPQKGPVHFNCAFREPLEDTHQDLPEKYINLARIQINREGPATKYLSLETSPNTDAISYLAETLAKTKKGLLVIGSLSSYEEKQTVKAFIEKLKWPTYFDISSSLKYAYNLSHQALPTFDHPEFIAGLVKNPPETVFHIGGRLTSKHYYTFLKQVPEINLVTLNQNIEKEDPSHHTKVRVNAQINSTLAKLSEKLDQLKLSGVDAFISFDAFAKKKIELIEKAPLSYPSISKNLIDTLPDQSILYLGNSTIVRTFDAYLTFEHKKDITIATNRGASGIEGFIASASGFIDGAKKDVYLVLGDVSLIHDLNSLYYLRDLTYNLKIIVVNNDGGGIFTLLPIHKEKSVIDYITSPHGQRFDKIAANFELHYQSVSKAKDLTTELNNLYNHKGHALLEIFVDNDINKSVYDDLKTIKL